MVFMTDLLWCCLTHRRDAVETAEDHVTVVTDGRQAVASDSFRGAVRTRRREVGAASRRAEAGRGRCGHGEPPPWRRRRTPS